MNAYLVTGGAGFIGSHTVEELLRRGHPVRVLDDLSTGRRSNLEPFLAEVDLIEGDVGDKEAVREAVAGMDYVLHAAAALPHTEVGDDTISLYETNVGGTTNPGRNQPTRRQSLQRSRPVSHSLLHSVYTQSAYATSLSLVRDKPARHTTGLSLTRPRTCTQAKHRRLSTKSLVKTLST